MVDWSKMSSISNGNWSLARGVAYWCWKHYADIWCLWSVKILKKIVLVAQEVNTTNNKTTMLLLLVCYLEISLEYSSSDELYTWEYKKESYNWVDLRGREL